MHLEITTRQSGKTTRMLKAIKKCKDKKICIVSNSMHSAKSIRGLFFFKHPKSKKDITVSTKMLQGYKNFVDEYDYISINNLFVDDNAYYCTTLKTDAAGKFTKLLIARLKKIKDF